MCSISGWVRRAFCSRSREPTQTDSELGEVVAFFICDRAQILQVFEFMKEAAWSKSNAMLETAWELACLLQFSDHLQLLPDKETMGSWRTPTRENPKSSNAFWFSFRIDVLTWLGVLGILLLKHQTSSLIQLKFWWDGFLLWLWLHFVFTDTFLKFPCEGGRSKHVQCNAWNCVRACLPTPVQWPPTAAAWQGNYGELKDTHAGEPQELVCLLIQLSNRCLDLAGCVGHSLANASNKKLNPTGTLHWWDGFLLWLWLCLLLTWRRQIEAHALKCLRANCWGQIAMSPFSRSLHQPSWTRCWSGVAVEPSGFCAQTGNGSWDRSLFARSQSGQVGKLYPTAQIPVNLNIYFA